MRFRVVFTVVFLLAVVGSASAHPLTDIQFDHTAAVRLASGGVEVTYTLKPSPLGLHLDSAKRLTVEDIAKLDKSIPGLARAYSKRVASELIEKFQITLDGQRLPLTVTSIDVTVTDHAECVFKLRAAWTSGGPERTLSVKDDTFADQPGIVELTLDVKGGSGPRINLIDSEEPPVRLRRTHSAKLTDAENDLARKASAMFVLPMAIAPSPHDARETPPGVGVPVKPEAIPEPSVNADVQSAPNLFEDLAARGLPALFDSKLGIGVLLLAAFLFGAAHAFTPGHGKTLVAAYLVGERGTVKHAVILAVATTIAHTGSVIALAAVLWGVYGNNVPGNAQGALQLVAGLLVIGVGLWLLLRRATGQADHFHLFAGHHHHHGEGDHGHSHSHEHDHGNGHHHHGPQPETAKTTAGWMRLVLMGLGGGLVPCWDAVLLLVAASALGRMGFALPMLFAFSAGLGVVLVLLGVAVVYAHRAGETRFKDSRWFKFLPVVSAVLLVGIGFWLCRSAVGMFGG